ncbi:MAG: hypothetical protein ACRC80_34315, partial [Waterburya sp.]
MKQFSTIKRWLATTLFCLFAIAFVWQGSFFSSNIAMANPTVYQLAANVGNEAQGKVSKDTGRTKDFVRDTTEKVKDAARSNAAKVDRATDDDSFIEGKAKRDAARIEQKANKDSARTQKAVDNTKNVIERT